MKPITMSAATAAGVELIDDTPGDGSPHRTVLRPRPASSSTPTRTRPFFLLLTLTAPHVPLDPHPDHDGQSAAAEYGDVVEEIDASIGRLFAALKAARPRRRHARHPHLRQRPLVGRLHRRPARSQGRRRMGRRLPRALHRPPARPHPRRPRQRLHRHEHRPAAHPRRLGRRVPRPPPNSTARTSASLLTTRNAAVAA